MSLSVLPKELQSVIEGLDLVDISKMRLLMVGVILKHKEAIDKYNCCDNCCDYADDNFSTYIFWHKYTFCSDWCSFDLEYNIRKSYMRQFKDK